MELRAALLPELAVDVTGAVCVVIDVLRATTVMATLFDRGCPGVFVAGSHAVAREYARTHGYALCGESDGYRVPDFDYGNSPVEMAALDFTGRHAVISTTNGTRATVAVAHARRVFLGAAVNASAVAAAAWDAAIETESDIVVVCSGTDTKFTLEDAMVAGLYIEKIAGHAGAWTVPEQDDAAIAARRLWQMEPNLLRGWMEGIHARRLADRGFGDDVGYCAAIDRLTCVPTLATDQQAGSGVLMAIDQAA